MAYRDTVLATAGLVSYWRLGEASGTVATDASGNARNGTNNGATPGAAGLLTGDTDTSYSFDGVNDLVEVPYAAALNTATFSVECWARVDGGAGTFRAVVSNRNNASDGVQGWIIYATSSNTWSLWTGKGSSNAWNASTGPAITTGAVVHLVGTLDGTTKVRKFYVNGVEVHSTTVDLWGPNTARPLRIGAGAGGAAADFFFNGPVDEVATYNVVLDATTIADHYTAGTTVPGGASHPLTTTLAGASTVAATALRLAHPLASTVSASSTATAAALAMSHPVTAVIAAASSATASSIRLNHPLVSTVAGTSSVSATLAPRSHPLTSAVSASSAVTAGGLTLGHPLTATTASAAVTTATGIIVGHALTATVAGASTATAARLTLNHPLIAYSAGTLSVVALISIGHPLAASVAGSSTVTAVFFVPITSAITFAASDTSRTFVAPDRAGTYAATDPTITYDGGTP